MARLLPLEFPGACYHFTARGDRQEPIFEDHEDRLVFLDLLACVFHAISITDSTAIRSLIPAHFDH